MNQLYPIIRRQRRPLVAVDVPPAPPQTGPVQPLAIPPPVEPAKSAPEKPRLKNASDDDTQN